MNDLMLGQVVRSTAGRDKGNFLIIVDIIDPNYVMIADGDFRKINHPKRKKVKHLAKTNQIASAIQEKLNNGEKIQNSEIRKVLQPFNTQNKGVKNEEI